MEIKKEVFQKHQFYTVKNNTGLEIIFCNYGASIYSIKYRGQVVSYHEDGYATFLKSKKYSGKTLGRVAGRIKDGLLKIDNKTYRLEKNEKGITLHGGKHNISMCDFETSISENDELIYVVFKYTSPHQEAGFPHEVRFIIVYSVSKNENKFKIHYHAITQGITPISLSTHTYWRLKDKDVLNHRLLINASEVTKLDNNLFVLGKEKVKKMYDFRRAKKIGQDLKAVIKDNKTANGYDHGYIFNKTDGPQIVLKNSKIKLSVQTDMDMANIFTNCYGGNNKIKSYGKDIPYGGIAIEPQMYLPTSRAKLISPEHPFDHYITFHLEDY